MGVPAPPYANEGPHALWHVSENRSIRRFEPHVSATASSDEPRVWAVDTRHLPLYWFPRDCPRATFWATDGTTDADRALLHGSSRVHAIEARWLDRMRAALLVAYRLPQEPFVRDAASGRYWIAREPVDPLDVVELGDLLALHAAAEIELRIVPSLWSLWERVVASTLDYSGIRLRNALPMLAS